MIDWTLIILAFVAMVCEDILGVIMTQAAARNRANLTGIMDTLGWFAGILTTTWTVTALQGHDSPYKVAMVLSVSAANYIGSASGVLIGKKAVRMRRDDGEETGHGLDVKGIRRQGGPGHRR